MLLNDILESVSLYPGQKTTDSFVTRRLYDAHWFRQRGEQLLDARCT